MAKPDVGQSITILAWLDSVVDAQLIAGGGLSSPVFVAPIVMWVILAGSAGIHWARQSQTFGGSASAFRDLR
jgi:hypothetical protein